MKISVILFNFIEIDSFLPRAASRKLFDYNIFKNIQKY